VQLEPDNSDVLRSALDLRYYANPRQLVNVSYLMDRDQPAARSGAIRFTRSILRCSGR
jgi:hypothetical protein